MIILEEDEGCLYVKIIGKSFVADKQQMWERILPVRIHVEASMVYTTIMTEGSLTIYHQSILFTVLDVEETFEDNYYRAVEMASDKDKQPWQLIKIHGMGHHEHIGDQSPFDLSTMHLTKEQFFNFCCDNIMDFNPTTWHSYMPVIKDVLLMDDDEEADLEHFVTGA